MLKSIKILFCVLFLCILAAIMLHLGIVFLGIFDKSEYADEIPNSDIHNTFDTLSLVPEGKFFFEKKYDLLGTTDIKMYGFLSEKSLEKFSSCWKEDATGNLKLHIGDIKNYYITLFYNDLPLRINKLSAPDNFLNSLNIHKIDNKSYYMRKNWKVSEGHFLILDTSDNRFHMGIMISPKTGAFFVRYIHPIRR